MVEESRAYAKDLDVVWEIIGGKPNNPHTQTVQFELKQDKFELRLLVAGDYRLFIVKTKPLKLEQSIHYADLSEIHCHDISKLTLVATDGRLFRMTSVGKETFADLLFVIFEKYSSINHSIPLNKRFPKLDAADDLKLNLIGCCTQLPHLIGPCGNFSNVYRWKCDQAGMEYHEDVAWDVNAIYNSQNCYELNLSDFDHLSPKSMIPMLASLEQNNWFTKLNLSNIKLTADMQNELLKVLKENNSIDELNLSNTGIKSEFLSKLLSPHGCSATSFDLSNNNLDDKGLHHLAYYINSRHAGMKYLNLSKTSVTSAGVNALARVLSAKQMNALTLEVLDLSGNSLKEELVALQNFLAQPNKLRVLKLADAETPLENFFAASLRGCTQHLEHLDLSGGRKGGSFPPSWKHFFASVSALKSVNFSNNRFSPEAYKLIFEGLEENRVVSDLELNFSGCQIGTSPSLVQALEQCLGKMTKVSSLDLSDNGFDQSISGIVARLVRNRRLKKLCIGRNLTNVKAKLLHPVIDGFVALIQEDGSTLESLSLEGMKLRGDSVDFINALGLNSSLIHLDLSGNMIGDVGAKMLSKALQLNRTLASLVLDNNQITCVGLECIASSLDRNTSLKILPVPLNDLISAAKLNPDRTERALRKIEQCIHRNGSSETPEDMGPAYKLQQWILNLDHNDFNDHIRELTRTMSSINSCRHSNKVQKLDDSVEEKLKRCEGILKEALDVKNVLSGLHELSRGTFDGEDSLLSDASKVFVEGTKEHMVRLKNYMDQNYHHSLKSFSQQSRYDPVLSAKEEAELEKRLRGSMLVTAGRILGPLNLEKSVRVAEFLIPSIALSLEFALVNAKSISKNLFNGEEGRSELVTMRSQDGDEEEKSSREERRTESWKNKIRPSSSIVSPTHSKTGTGTPRLSAGSPPEPSDVHTPVPKPRKKKNVEGAHKTTTKMTQQHHDVESKGMSSKGLDVLIPNQASFELGSGRDRKMASFFPLASEKTRKHLFGALTKSLSHDELDEKERPNAKDGSMARKKSKSRDALEDLVPCQQGQGAAVTVLGIGGGCGGGAKSTATPAEPPKERNVSVGSGSDLGADAAPVEANPEDDFVIIDYNDKSNDSKSGESPVRKSLGDLEVPTERLTHLCKDRPKRPKTKLPTKPIATLEGLKELKEDYADGEHQEEEAKEKEKKKMKMKIMSKGKGEEEDEADAPSRKDSSGSANGIYEDGEGIAEGLKIMFSKKNSTSESPTITSESPPSLHEHLPVQSKIVNEFKLQNDPGKASSGMKSNVKEEGKPLDIRKRRTTEGSLIEPVDSKPSIRSSTGQVLSTSVGSSQPSTGGAPSVTKRTLPPGAKPGFGLGGFAMPSANEIQQKRLSMRPVSENLAQADQPDDKKPSGNPSEVGTTPDPQQAKMRPPPPLAPKPIKSFRDSRRVLIKSNKINRESDVSIGSSSGGVGPVIITDDSSSRGTEDANNKPKRKEEEQSKPATPFMEEFRKKQEKNKPSESPKP